MKSIFLLLCPALLLFAGSSYCQAQQQAATIDSSYNNSYYAGRMALFRTLPPTKNGIVFLGNSITERGAWNELLPGKLVLNRGIGGDNSFGVLARLDSILLLTPEKIFLLIGINDLSRGLPPAVIANNIQRIVAQVKSLSPRTKIFLQSVLPLNENKLSYEYLKNKAASIRELNTLIAGVAQRSGVTFIDLHPIMTSKADVLKPEFTSDGIHLEPAAYAVWIKFLKSKKYL